MPPHRTHPWRVLGRGDGTASLNSKPKKQTNDTTPRDARFTL